MVNLNALNSEQREAVTTLEGPVLILAGAGSGKTRVLTYRIAYLVENGVYPGNILAITFTNKAAAEMKQRVEELVGAEARSMWITTFHSACVRILRQEAEKIGHNKNFVIYDTSDQEKLIKECLTELNLDDKLFPPKKMLSKIGSLKDKLIEADAFYIKNSNDYEKRNLAEIYKLYQKKLKSNNAMDFDDIIIKTVFLFQNNPDVLSHYQRKFRYILVDEYQDTNMAQYELINLLAKSHGNLCVVGDDDQSIYGWRGADIKNILEFEKDYPKVKIVKLEQNYRCTKKILEAANYVIANNENRKEKRLWTENKEGDAIKFYKAENDREEAAFILNKIKAMVDVGSSYRDFAVLYRTNAMSRILGEAFVTSSIPYRVIGGQKFYDRKEVKDIVSYLKFLNNPVDSISLERIINTPRRGIGDSTIDKIKEFARQQDMNLYSAMLDIEQINGINKRAVNSIEKFVGFMNELMLNVDTLKVSELITEVFERTGYYSELKEDNTKESQDRIEYVQELYSAAVEFEKASEDKTLALFLERIALVSDQDQLSEGGGITLMTLHTAKGLEFPVVFIAGMENGIFPHHSYQDDEDDLEEERRLLYVGITRAKEELFLTCARERMTFGKTSFNEVSSFIDEIPENLIENLSKKTSNYGRIYNYEPIIPKKSNVSNSLKTSILTQSPIIKTAPEKKAAAGDMTVKAGDKIVHKLFGKGLVIAIKDSGGDKIITVHFESTGLKNLMLKTAPIEKI